MHFTRYSITQNTCDGDILSHKFLTVLGLHRCKDGKLSLWRIAKIGISELRNPWTDCHKIWHGWLSHTYCNHTRHCGTGSLLQLRTSQTFSYLLAVPEICRNRACTVHDAARQDHILECFVVRSCRLVQCQLAPVTPPITSTTGGWERSITWSLYVGIFIGNLRQMCNLWPHVVKTHRYMCDGF